MCSRGSVDCWCHLSVCRNGTYEAPCGPRKVQQGIRISNTNHKPLPVLRSAGHPQQGHPAAYHQSLHWEVLHVHAGVGWGTTTARGWSVAGRRCPTATSGVYLWSPAEIGAVYTSCGWPTSSQPQGSGAAAWDFLPGHAPSAGPGFQPIQWPTTEQFEAAVAWSGDWPKDQIGLADTPGGEDEAEEDQDMADLIDFLLWERQGRSNRQTCDFPFSTLVLSCAWHCYFHVFDIFILTLLFFMCLTLVLSCVLHCYFHELDVICFQLFDIIAISCYVQIEYDVITFSYLSRVVVFSLRCFVWNTKNNVGLVYFQLHTLFSITCNRGYQLYPICKLSLILSWSVWLKKIDKNKKKMIKIKVLVN